MGAPRGPVTRRCLYASHLLGACQQGLEHEYTLTPSAIGTWIGEDVKAIGGEGTWELSGNGQRARLTVAGFSGVIRRVPRSSNAAGRCMIFSRSSTRP